MADTPLLVGQVNRERYSVYNTGGSCLHLVQLGEAAGMILAIISPVGQMLCSNLNKNEVSRGPRGHCLARLQEEKYHFFFQISGQQEGDNFSHMKTK